MYSNRSEVLQRITSHSRWLITGTLLPKGIRSSPASQLRRLETELCLTAPKSEHPKCRALLKERVSCCEIGCFAKPTCDYNADISASLSPWIPRPPRTISKGPSHKAE
eukprot:Lithocolla_globosa_v1_NODE_1001_length_2963_cov_36.286107.p3 type:complete len:108 gc:universal NODE_1001_length_2963_cov_36.286107:810-487(-)